MEKTKIRALILDYGGVISRPQNPDNVASILRMVNQERDGFEKVYRGRRGDYDNGRLSGEQYWAGVLAQFGLTLSAAEIAVLIREDVASWTQISDEMIAFVEGSKDRLHRLAIVSNMTWDTLGYMREHCRWLGLFDTLVFSCEVGTNKPEPEIYAACLARLGIPSGECLFVDDSTENVAGAERSGMNVIHYQSFPAFQEELERRFYFSR